jgi:uncharacterized protein
MKKTCSCQNRFQKASPQKKDVYLLKIIFLHVFLIIAWWFIYLHLQSLASFVTYDLLAIAKNSRLGESVRFFVYDTPKVFLLLTGVVYLVGLLRSFINPQKTRKFLAGKSELIGNIFAALLGIITPFCSCSAVPLFIGFVTAGIPLGVTFSFLISAPMINEIALVLLYGFLGWKIAAIYLAMGLSIAILSGIIIGRLCPEKHLEDWVKKIRAEESSSEKLPINWRERVSFGAAAVTDILRRIWFFVLIGIVVGAIIHGYVPQSFMAAMMGTKTWWSVPLAVILGIPLYSNAAGIIPIVEALIGKGAAIGTVLAFMMSVIALSLPEMLILRKVLKPKLLFLFALIVTLGIIVVGYLFNWLILL